MKLDVYRDFLCFGQFSDLFIEESKSLSLSWEEEKTESIIRSEESGVGLRYVNGQETRFGFTDLPQPLLGYLSDQSRDKMHRIRDKISDNLPVMKQKPAKTAVRTAHPIRISPLQVSLDEKLALLERVFKSARKGTHVRQVNIRYGEKVKNVGYLNSDGEAFLEKRTYLVLSITVTVEKNGDLQTAYDAVGGIIGWELFDGNMPEILAEQISERAHLKLAAPQAPVGEMTVVISSTAGGTLIHEAVGHSLEADAVLEGTSPSYRGKLGQVVANSKLTVFDDPTVPRARGSFYFDDEGVQSRPTKLIENGVLRDLMYDRMSASRAHVSSNGHGRRESYAHKPIPRMSNTFIAPGKDNPAEIIKSLKNGLLVTKMGGGQVNTANGDFVFDVEEGFQVQNGRKRMVRGATLLGNGPEVLRSIDLVGSDHGWGIGTCGKEGQGVPVSDAMPTIRIKKLVVGGR